MVSGPSKSQHEETVVADVHPAPVHRSNTQVFTYLFVFFTGLELVCLQGDGAFMSYVLHCIV